MKLLLNINGSIGRSGWWLGQFANLGLLIVAITILITSSDADLAETFSMLDMLATHPSILFLFVLMLWINICLTVKRYHDLGKSGWWFLVCLLPFIGVLWQCVECGFSRGKDEANSYRDASHTYSDGDSYEVSSSVDDQIAAMVLKNKQAERSNAEQEPVRNIKPGHAPSFGKAAAPAFGKR